MTYTLEDKVETPAVISKLPPLIITAVPYERGHRQTVMTV